MVIPRMLKSQVMEQIRLEVARLQAEARMVSFDRMMYEVNDSLVSILAITEVEPKDAVPRIKRYIHRINQSLQNVKSGQVNSASEKLINMNSVVSNLLKVVGENYKSAKFTEAIMEIRAPAQGDQNRFEQWLLTVLVDLLGREDPVNEIEIDIRQKDQFVLVSVSQDKSGMTEVGAERISRILEESPEFRGRFQLTPKGAGFEAVLRLPLQFQVVKTSTATEKIPEAKKA